jgi:CRP/FNR family transcriptional regulator
MAFYQCNECGSRKFSFFADSCDAEMEVIDASKSCNNFRKGQMFFYEGSRPLGLYCIKAGKIKLFKTGHDGKEQIISFAQSGDFLGYRSLIAEELYHSSAMALEDTSACFIPKENFFKLLSENPDLSRSMLKSLCHDLGIANEKIKSMAQKSVKERLAETLMFLQDTFKRDAKDENLINITLPREDIANIVGTATETVIRMLTVLEEEKLVVLEGRKIRIQDRKGLEKIAQVYA